MPSWAVLACLEYCSKNWWFQDKFCVPFMKVIPWMFKSTLFWEYFSCFCCVSFFGVNQKETNLTQLVMITFHHSAAMIPKCNLDMKFLTISFFKTMWTEYFLFSHSWTVYSLYTHACRIYAPGYFLVNLRQSEIVSNQTTRQVCSQNLLSGSLENFDDQIFFESLYVGL